MYLKKAMYKPLIETIRGKKGRTIPIWFMRQAGRYLAEYRQIRQHFASFTEMCLNRDAATTVALQPLEIFDLNAAIVFSDIMMLPHALGIEVDFVENKGPVLNRLFVDYDLNSLVQRDWHDNTLNSLNDSVKSLCTVMRALHPSHAIIGFSASPWTLFCYLTEGQGSRDFAAARRAVYENKQQSCTAIEYITQKIIEYLEQQIASGVEVIQLFDSWAGVLPYSLHNEWIIKPTATIVSSLKRKYLK